MTTHSELAKVESGYEFPAKKLALRLRNADLNLVESVEYWKIPVAVINIIAEYALHLHAVRDSDQQRRSPGPTMLLNLSNLSMMNSKDENIQKVPIEMLRLTIPFDATKWTAQPGSRITEKWCIIGHYYYAFWGVKCARFNLLTGTWSVVKTPKDDRSFRKACALWVINGNGSIEVQASGYDKEVWCLDTNDGTNDNGGWFRLDWWTDVSHFSSYSVLFAKKIEDRIEVISTISKDPQYLSLSRYNLATKKWDQKGDINTKLVGEWTVFEHTQTSNDANNATDAILYGICYGRSGTFHLCQISFATKSVREVCTFAELKSFLSVSYDSFSRAICFHTSDTTYFYPLDAALTAPAASAEKQMASTTTIAFPID